MPWSAPSIFNPTLPPHCEPTNDFLHLFSAIFHSCVPTPLAFASNTLGILSILAWLFAQLPQIYKNYRISSTSGLSFFFLVEWCLGDSCNLLGALFTHQASWQVAIGSYYVFVDLCLVTQWLWYEKLRHGNRVWKLRPQRGAAGPDDGPDSPMRAVVVDGSSSAPPPNRRQSEDEASKSMNPDSQPSRPRIIFRTPTFQKTDEEKPSSSLGTTPNSNSIYRIGPSSPLPSPSPRTVLLIACLIALTHASPLQTKSHSSSPHAPHPTPLEYAGTILSWLSTLLYLGSRLPQLIKNWQRQSTAGLSPQLFAAAFCGNLLYSCALVTNPCAWYDFGPYGGGGWVGSKGSERAVWVPAALPFFLGAAGVLGLDASVGVQFLLYGEAESKMVVMQEDGKVRGRRWRRVSGWMRGWIPSNGESKGEEDRGLLEGARSQAEGYGAASS